MTMAGGFGFARYPQRKTPASQDVGMALMQQGQAGGAAPAEMPYGPGQMAPMEQSFGPGQMAPASTASVGGDPLREDGARRMSGAGQIDDNASEDDGTHSANAVNVAIGEALTRQGGGYRTNPNPFKPRDRALRNLQQLGLSETEAMLLIQTGGA